MIKNLLDSTIGYIINKKTHYINKNIYTLKKYDEFDFETGDIVLASGLEYKIKLGLNSPFSHVGLIVLKKDLINSLQNHDNNFDEYNDFIDRLNNSDDILYFQSTFDEKYIDIISEIPYKSGVQLNNFKDALISGDEIGVFHAIRKLKSSIDRSEISNTILDLLIKYKNTPFEKSDMEMILASVDLYDSINITKNIQNYDSIFCSELVASVLKLSNAINFKEQPNEITPDYFTYNSIDTPYINLDFFIASLISTMSICLYSYWGSNSTTMGSLAISNSYLYYRAIKSRDIRWQLSSNLDNPIHIIL